MNSRIVSKDITPVDSHNVNEKLVFMLAILSFTFHLIDSQTPTVK